MKLSLLSECLHSSSRYISPNPHRINHILVTKIHSRIYYTIMGTCLPSGPR